MCGNNDQRHQVRAQRRRENWYRNPKGRFRAPGQAIGHPGGAKPSQSRLQVRGGEIHKVLLFADSVDALYSRSGSDYWKFCHWPIQPQASAVEENEDTTRAKATQGLFRRLVSGQGPPRPQNRRRQSFHSGPAGMEGRLEDCGVMK